MNIYDYLKCDHEYIAHLFRQFFKSELSERRTQIVDMINRQLIVHDKSEQDTFYKVLEDYDQGKKDALIRKKEHRDIEMQLNVVMNAKDQDASWIKEVEKLQKLVDQHVYDEEHRVFKQARKVLSEEEALIIKEKMHFLKQQLLFSFEKKKLARVS